MTVPFCKCGTMVLEAAGQSSGHPNALIMAGYVYLWSGNPFSSKAGCTYLLWGRRCQTSIRAFPYGGLFSMERKFVSPLSEVFKPGPSN